MAEPQVMRQQRSMAPMSPDQDLVLDNRQSDGPCRFRASLCRSLRWSGVMLMRTLGGLQREQLHTLSNLERNQVHGNAFELNRNTVYDAKTWFQPVRGVDQQNEFGFDVGGPIKHDKVFFYGYYDGFRYKTSNTGTFYSLLTPAMKKGDFSSADNYMRIFLPSMTPPLRLPTGVAASRGSSSRAMVCST